MSDDVLSRNDVESLLKSLEGNASAVSAPTPASPVKSDSRKGAPKVRVLNYDFKRPERVGKEQMRALQSLHDGFSRNFGASLSAMLRSIIEVRLISVDQLTYSEFVYSLEIPTCFNLLKPLPLDGNWVLDISPSLLYPIIDRMLGGTVNNESIPKRPLSEIELRLAARITNVFLKELQNAWGNVADLDLQVERVESNPQLVQIVPPNEVVVMVSFELTMGAIRGTTNLCIPFNTIERVGSKLTSNSWIGYAAARTNNESVSKMSTRLDGSVADMVVTLARTSITTSELFGLEVGDIISTEKDIHHPLEVEIANRVKFLASAGAYKGRKAIKIEQIVGKS
ncbi:MAG: flagellar motor switch protein FliM [Pirellula sp.]|jgi:flagellar motor switch protein FliM|nr:flagellar motor switch protein FliM [Pirellula sp.]